MPKRCQFTKTLKKFKKLGLKEEPVEEMFPESERECTTILNSYNVKAGAKYCSLHQIRGVLMEDAIQEEITARRAARQRKKIRKELERKKKKKERKRKWD